MNKFAKAFCELFGHAWIDMRNEVVENGWLCRRCGKVKP